MKRTQGFTLVELSIALVIIGMLTGAVLGGVNMISSSKVKRQVSDLQALTTAVNSFYDTSQAMPGDANADGTMDSDASVWTSLETQNLANRSKRGPYGNAYAFGYAATTTGTQRTGNYVSVSLPIAVAKNIDAMLDEGTYNKGTVTASANYTGSGRVTLYYFID